MKSLALGGEGNIATMSTKMMRFVACAVAFFLPVLSVTVPVHANDAAPTTAPAQTARERANAYLAAGNERSGERLIEGLLQDTVKNHVRPEAEDVFFAAVCTRSRFEVAQAAPLFHYVAQVNGSTTHGQAAGLILAIDSRQGDVEANFVALDQLWFQNQSDPLLLWMVAVQCRSLKKANIGVNRYARLCEMWKPGPVLVHQTYANLLDELHRPEEALVHRQIAVTFEPESWSYDGLANTLTALHRWDEADVAFSESTRLAPAHAQLWINWAISKQARGDSAGASQLMAKAEELKQASQSEKK